MKKLKIRNFGPLAEANLDLDRVNLIVGLQSSGKSCALKTACHCSWVEKRMELAQSADAFSKEGEFLDKLCDYHKMKDYICPDTFIEYESQCVKFAYDHAKRKFSFKWKRAHWDYKRPKISYVPSERNLLATIPMWSKLPLESDNLLDFMTDWDVARKQINQVNNILELGLSYRYDSKSNTDAIIMPSGNSIRLTEGSSGMQSLLPLFVHLNYLFDPKSRDQDDLRQSYEQKEERKRLVKLIASYLHAKKDKSKGSELLKSTTWEGQNFYFRNIDECDRFDELVDNHLATHHNEIFLEEPENNLFPPTQCQLVNWLLEKMSEIDWMNMLFVATHSPYVLNQFIKEYSEGLRLFITHPDAKSGKYIIKQLSDDDVREIYGNGVDLFFNFEAYR